MCDSFEERSTVATLAYVTNKAKKRKKSQDCMWLIYIFCPPFLHNSSLLLLCVLTCHLRAATVQADYRCTLTICFLFCSPPRGTGSFLWWKEMDCSLPSTKPCRPSTFTLASSYPAIRFLEWRWVIRPTWKRFISLMLALSNCLFCLASQWCWWGKF